LNSMIIVVGLGNPGEKFQKTRHNLGFLVLNELIKKNNFSNWKKSKKINCLYAKGSIAGKEIELVKPLTYMNNSGKVVKYIAKKNNLSRKNIFVVHDDIDLPLGKIRISKGRSSAGHKGVQSIINELGTKDFVRFRVGIHPEFGKPENPEEFVLEKFKREEEKIVKEVVKKTTKAIKIAIKEGIEKAQST